jgi:hypothetical protein
MVQGDIVAPGQLQSSKRFRHVFDITVAINFLLLGCVLFSMREVDLWRNPFQVGRVWQSFDLADELERVRGVPWATEISTMSGGTKPAPFLQEFPLAQYAVWLLKESAGLSTAQAGQAIAGIIALASVAVWLRYAWLLPVEPPGRLLIGGLIFFVPGFLRYGPTAVPDALVFLFNLGGGCLIVFGRRRRRDGLVTLGAILIGLAVLTKGPALIPAAVIGIALLREKRWHSVVGLFVAAVPGLAWAALASSVNKNALSINEFARVGALRAWWWNPHIYLQPWWVRDVGYRVYDGLGLLGLVACVWIGFTTPLRAKASFEFIMMFGPAVAMILLFNYHSATHGYYCLVWLPFTMIGAVELALKTPRSENLRISRGLIASVVICLAIFGTAERQFGLVEKMASGNPGAADPLIHFRAPASVIDQRKILARSALLGLKNRASFVAYLGNDEGEFFELGMRGWLVGAPPADQGVADRKRHVPASVINAEEWRQLSVNWFSEHLNRGMDAVLIESGETLDTPEVLGWARTAGLDDANQHPPGYILLLRRQ